ncbi:hypothetical protein TNCV_3588751 [Trichonephila clavipes]|nr:hypothetical protein TNCV_3588751 [Trichonephila clavipes]
MSINTFVPMLLLLLKTVLKLFRQDNVQSRLAVFFDFTHITELFSFQTCLHLRKQNQTKLDRVSRVDEAQGSCCYLSKAVKPPKALGMVCPVDMMPDFNGKTIHRPVIFPRPRHSLPKVP